jgi:hypothetical protein
LGLKAGVGQQIAKILTLRLFVDATNCDHEGGY